MPRRSSRAFVVVAVAIAVALATAASPFASSSPDGLNRVAADHGFAGRARVQRVQDSSPIPGYAFRGIRDARLARAVAGFTGTLGVFALGWGVAVLVRRRRDGAGAVGATS